MISFTPKHFTPGERAAGIRWTAGLKGLVDGRQFWRIKMYVFKWWTIRRKEAQANFVQNKNTQHNETIYKKKKYLYMT